MREGVRDSVRHAGLLASRELRRLWRLVVRTFPPVGRFVEFTWGVLRKYYHDDCFSYAGGLSFWFLISLVPMSTLLFKMLVLLLGKRAYTEGTRQALEAILPFLPQNFIIDAIHNSQQIGGTVLSWSVLLFGSYWGIAQLDTSLAHVFGLRIKKHRQTRKNPLLRQVAILVLGMVLLALFLALLVGGALQHLVPAARRHALLPYLPGLLWMVVMTVLLQHIPRLHVKLRHALVGAFTSVCLVWLARWAFAVYLRHTFTWGIMYGSLVGTVAALTFLYYACAIFLLGAEITAAFYRHDTGTASLRLKGTPGD